MRKLHKLQWKRLALTMLSGAVLLQTPACAETALYITTASSVFTAGGVLYLVSRVLS